MAVLNPDGSADWLTEQFCNISSTVIQCCDVQKSSSEDLYNPALEIFRLYFQSVCPVFNVSSLKESQFKAYLRWGDFCQFADRIRQVANISSGATRPQVDAWERIGDSSVRF